MTEMDYIGPRPDYQPRIEKSVRVPMRDGIRLSTDLHFPDGAKQPLPCVLIRTPYNKNTFREDPLNIEKVELFVGQAYVVAIQDKRGRYESESDYILAGGDAEDGYDTVGWLAEQEWCNGNIGTFGCSYLGETQIYQAKLRHPNLKAMIPQAAGGATGSLGGRYTRWGVRNGGAINLASLVGWMIESGSKVYARPPAELSDEDFSRIAHLFTTGPRAPEVNLRELLNHLPIIEILEKCGAAPCDYGDVIRHDYDDKWWQQFDYLDVEDHIDVPMLHIDSWYDPAVAETLERFAHFKKTALSASTRDMQFAIIGPGSHCQSEYAEKHTIVGERDVGDARFGHWDIYIKWFNHWLKDETSEVVEMPRLQYYLMGKGEWRSAESWPLPQTRFTPLYLHSDGNANSCSGDGTLTFQAPDDEECPDKFIYDPANPVPSCGGALIESVTEGMPAGANDQRDIEARNDVLVYTSSPLEQGIEVTGPLKLVLYVSSSATDTDFTAKLVDVEPSGAAYNIQEGILRMRYRESAMSRKLMQAGDIYKIEIDLQASSIFFAKKHRIRLEVSSSNFPRFDRNLNTGGNNFDESEGKVARNTVLHSTQHPSHLLLPLIP
jgi:putative CocE/NonD family hydrolase